MVNSDLSSEELSASSVMRAMKMVVDKLERGRGVEAVRLFGNALNHGITSPATDLVQWLIKAIGKSNASKLIVAYAYHPCFSCKKGLEVCEECEGRGHWGNTIVCRMCVTTGIARCNFCDGTGFASYDVIPSSLRLPVALGRVKFAAKELESILRRPAPQSSRDQPHDCLKLCSKRLMNVNRLMGVLENALILAKDIGESQPHLRLVLVKIPRICTQYTYEGKQRIRDILQCMVKCSYYETQDTRLKPLARNIAKKRIALLESILEPSSTFSGTSLEHPFLYQRGEEFKRKAMGSGELSR